MTAHPSTARRLSAAAHVLGLERARGGSAGARGAGRQPHLLRRPRLRPWQRFSWPAWRSWPSSPPRSSPSELAVGLIRPTWVWPLHLGVVGVLAGLVAAGLLEEVLGAVLDDLSQVSAPVTVVGGVIGGWLLTRAYVRRPLLRGHARLSGLRSGRVPRCCSPSPRRAMTFSSRRGGRGRGGGERPAPTDRGRRLRRAPAGLGPDGDASAIDAERFPNLARLAADGTWYPNTTSVAAYTHEAVPAILTGQGVRDENLPPSVSGHPDTLFTLLADEYEISAHEQLTALCAPAICDESTGDEPDAVLPRCSSRTWLSSPVTSPCRRCSTTGSRA